MVQRPWLNHYDAGVPTTLEPYPELTLVDYLVATARDEPAHTVLLYKGNAMSAARLERLSNAFAAALVDLGVERGDRVAMVLPNCPQFLVAEFGAWKAGAIIAPIDPSLEAGEQQELLARIAPRVLVVLSTSYARAKAAQQVLGIEHLIVTSIKEHLPRRARIMFALFRESREGHRPRLAKGDRWMADLIEIYRGAFRPSLTITPDDDATLLATDGSGGTPKLVLGTHRSPVASGFQMSAWFRDLAAPEGDTVMLASPLFHVYGLCTVQALALMARLPLALVPDHRELPDLLGTIQRVQPSFLAGVPSVFAGLAGHSLIQTNKVSLSALKLCLSGAAPLPPNTRARFEELAGCPLLQCYGLTESQGANVVQPLSVLYKSGSVGMPLPDSSVRVHAIDGASLVSLGERGEIWLRCPQIMRGYWGDDAGTAAILPASMGERWIRTGDLGYLDSDGYLFVVDRLQDRMTLGRFTVWPREIEEVIASHPGVADVCVASVPDEVQGDVASAWIVAEPGRTLVEDEIRAHCRRHLIGHKVPVRITFSDAIPRSAVGRVQRRRLVERYLADRGSALAASRADRPVSLPAHAEGMLGERLWNARSTPDRRPHA